MSLATLPVSPLLPAGSQAADQLLAQWEAWLHDIVDPRWRPGEWNADHLLFTGDVNNPRTIVRLCEINECDVATDLSRFCTGCSRELRLSGLTSADFEKSFVPQRNRRFDTIEICIVPKCARYNSTRGLCQAHYQGWHKASVIRGLHSDLPTWVGSQRAYEALPECVVRGCGRAGTNRHPGLCMIHVNQWGESRKVSGVAADDKAALAKWLEHAPPYMSVKMFSLAPLAPLARLEMLYALQQRDARGQNLPPRAVKTTVRLLADLPSIAFGGDAVPDPRSLKGARESSFLTELQWTLASAIDDFRGVDPTRKLTWDMRVVSQLIPSLGVADGSPLFNHGGVDFSLVHQAWLREVVMHWARTTGSQRRDLRENLKAAVMASKALNLRPGGGIDPSALQYADVDAVVEGFKTARRPNGELYRPKTQNRYMGRFFELLEFGRREGVPESLSPRFVRHSHHKIKEVEENEDEIGKSLPDVVIRQLDQNMHTAGEIFSYGRQYPREAIKALFRTAYVIMRDTGRRTGEIAGLSLNCLEFDQGKYQLIWDNTKAGRLRRRLPVYSETVDVIKAWKEVRAGLDLPMRSSNALFPAIGEVHDHILPGYLSDGLREWVDLIPALDSDELGPDGMPLPFDRKRIFPYAFRHTFCQRHADAGIPQHVLQELMDHDDPKTTGAYYRVSHKMKREAMDVVRKHSMDRFGNAAPMSSAIEYDMGSVAVQYGNCKEPSNVKAGGHACPIRYQCSGCPSFHPDPSHLPSIEDHVRALKTNLELAQAMGVADYTITGLEGEIGDYRGVIEKMKAKLERMTDQERAEIEEASRVLRRLRAGSDSSRHVTLGMPGFGPPEQDS
ncbi:tyrosine-type recombinase/integrase [Streptomyces sp. 21So2-11]|uniref:tyrosine-type recombinase/integrase n=1 Tax=Streptomyces sp. 21So2-11 TaxID=3144408 RepID=UPI0032190178